ncbi:hypothetical protein BDV19DRAFT_379508 [Aspergillus venezuelensis]
MALVTIELPTRDPYPTCRMRLNKPQRWNGPSTNKWRMPATFASFASCAVVGASDGVYGMSALVPYLVNPAVSLIFMTPFEGYTLACTGVNKIHMKFGQRRLATLAPLCHLIPFIIMATVPHFSVLLVAYAFIGLGNGLIGAGWNTWISDMVNASTLMGLFHTSYGLGRVTSRRGATLELVASGLLFWSVNAEQFNLNNPSAPGSTSHSLSVGGWIVDFTMQVRDGSAVQSVSQVVLGLANEILGKRIAVVIYLLVPQFIVPDVAVSLIGFFTGPLFPATVTVAVKLLPKRLYTLGIDMASAFVAAPFDLALLVTITVL